MSLLQPPTDRRQAIALSFAASMARAVADGRTEKVSGVDKLIVMARAILDAHREVRNDWWAARGGVTRPATHHGETYRWLTHSLLLDKAKAARALRWDFFVAVADAIRAHEIATEYIERRFESDCLEAHKQLFSSPE